METNTIKEIGPNIIKMEILLIKILYHRTICLLKFHYNTLLNVTNIYRQKFFAGVLTDGFYRWINSINNVVCNIYMPS